MIKAVLFDFGGTLVETNVKSNIKKLIIKSNEDIIFADLHPFYNSVK